METQWKKMSGHLYHSSIRDNHLAAPPSMQSQLHTTFHQGTVVTFLTIFLLYFAPSPSGLVLNNTHVNR